MFAMWSVKAVVICWAVVSASLFSLVLGVQHFPDHAQTVQAVWLGVNLAALAISGRWI